MQLPRPTGVASCSTARRYVPRGERCQGAHLDADTSRIRSPRSPPTPGPASSVSPSRSGAAVSPAIEPRAWARSRLVGTTSRSRRSAPHQFSGGVQRSLALSLVLVRSSFAMARLRARLVGTGQSSTFSGPEAPTCSRSCSCPRSRGREEHPDRLCGTWANLRGRAVRRSLRNPALLPDLREGDPFQTRLEARSYRSHTMRLRPDLPPSGVASDSLPRADVVPGRGTGSPQVALSLCRLPPPSCWCRSPASAPPPPRLSARARGDERGERRERLGQPNRHPPRRSERRAQIIDAALRVFAIAMPPTWPSKRSPERRGLRALVTLFRDRADSAAVYRHHSRPRHVVADALTACAPRHSLEVLCGPPRLRRVRPTAIAMHRARPLHTLPALDKDRVLPCP